MNYWLLTTEYPPFFGGGISTYCHFTAKMLGDKGHQISVFINDTSVNKVEVIQNGNIRLIRFNPVQTDSTAFLGHVTNISYEFAYIVKAFIEVEGAPDLIEAQEYLGIAYYLLQYKYLSYDWCRDIPIVITMHSPSFLYMEYNHVSEYKYPNFWICEMERFCLQAADLLISPSAFMLQELRKRMELRNENIKVIPNPFHSVKDRLLSNNDTGSQIVFYGKLTVQKGAFKLLAYFDHMWKNRFIEPLYLIGGQDIVYHPEGRTMGDILRSKYEHYIAAGLLHLEDRIKPSEIASRLSKAKVVIIPSANDNLPYVVFEMMSLGRIVLVSKQGGHAEVVEDGIDGFIFDHNQPETFYAQLDRILNLSASEKVAIESAAIQKVTNHYSLDAIYYSKIEACNTLLQAKRRIGSSFPFIRAKGEPLKPTFSKENSFPLLSVIIPYYNMGAYIEETVRSVQQSAYPSKEIIIINDGSTDLKSLSALDQFRHTEGITVWDKTNEGLGATRNFGVAKANGNYIAFLDADDTVHPEYYKKALTVLMQYDNVDFVGCWTKYFEGSSATWPCFSPEPPLALYHNVVNTSALVMKKAAFEEAGGNDTKMVFQGLEDYDFLLALTARGRNGVVLPETLFNYRVRKKSMIRDITSTKKILLLQQITEKYKVFYGSFAAEITNLLNANGPGYKYDNPSLDFHFYSGNSLKSRILQKLVIKVKQQPMLKKMALRIYRQMKSFIP